ncbi:MAG TPA: GyrI-like domain-containing protein [Gemmatimonadaceae bacterium]|nr:GyrI-like domain-containing protein [Gemmatimonadaceae bacterium]
MSSSAYDVSVQLVPARAIAVVKARVAASRVSAAFRESLDQVYAAGKRGDVQLDGQNIFVYRPVSGAPTELDVEFGVGVKAPFAGAGNVESATTPAGNAAHAVHRGDYGALGAAHEAIAAWCGSNGHRLAGPRWEVYGHWSANETPRTDVYYLLEREA